MNRFDSNLFNRVLTNIEEMSSNDLSTYAQLGVSLEESQDSVPMYRVMNDFTRNLHVRVHMGEGTPLEIVARMQESNYSGYISQMCTPADTSTLMEVFTTYGLYYSPIIARPAKEGEDFIARVREAVQAALKTLAMGLMELVITEMTLKRQEDAQPVSAKSPFGTPAKGDRVYIERSEAYAERVGISGKLLRVDENDDSVPYLVEPDDPKFGGDPFWVMDVQTVQVGDRVMISSCKVIGWNGCTGTITDVRADGYTVRCSVSGDTEFVESVIRIEG